MKLNFLILLLAITTLVGLSNVNHILVSDELDYADAVELGFIQNYLESDSISTYEFFAQTLTALVQKTEMNTWKQMQERGDVMSLRHFHGPVAYYGYNVFSQLFPSQSLRWLSVMLSISLLVLLLFAINEVEPIVKFLLMSSFCCYLIYSGQTVAITPHILYATIVMLTLLLARKLMTNKNPVCWYLLCALIAVAVATLEYSVFLLTSILFLIYLKKPNQLGLTKKELLRGLLVFILASAAIWPAGFFKLKILVSYAKYSYLAIFSDYYGSIRDSLFLSSYGHGILFIMIAATLLLYLSNKLYRQNQARLPFIIYGLLIFCVNLPNHFVYPQYAFSFIPILLVPTAVVLSQIFKKSIVTKVSIIALLVVATFINIKEVTHSIEVSNQTEKTQRKNLIAISKKLHEDREVMLIGYGNYIAKRNLDFKANLTTLDPDIDSIRSLTANLNNKPIDAVIYMHNSKRVFKKVSSEAIKAWLSSNFEVSLSGSDYTVFRRN